MKTTDFAMIFIAIVLPVIVIVYVDIIFLLKKEEQTLYYKNIIDSAITDATYAMKNVEGMDNNIDYGYSGVAEKNVTVNPKVAVDTFFKSLYDNFEVKGDKLSEAYIKEHIPAMAIVDYNGVYIYSLEEYTNSKGSYIEHILKPKRYFSYIYGINNEDNTLITGEEIENTYGMDEEYIEYVNVIFTMDDLIGVIQKDGTIVWFYIEDKLNNSHLYGGNESLKNDIIRHLKLQRQKVISDIVSDEMSYAVNRHNLYSEVEYDFSFPDIALSDWEQMVNNVGIIAFMQGINLGNIKLDYVGHGISGLKMTERYYVSKKTTNVSDENYYHNTDECNVYIESDRTFNGYYLNKVDAATGGYYPCPVCKP